MYAHADNRSSSIVFIMLMSTCTTATVPMITCTTDCNCTYEHLQLYPLHCTSCFLVTFFSLFLQVSEPPRQTHPTCRGDEECVVCNPARCSQSWCSTRIRPVGPGTLCAPLDIPSPHCICHACTAHTCITFGLCNSRSTLPASSFSSKHH